MLMARGKVHDRTTRDVPFNAVVATVEVDDPYPVPGVSRRIKATASLRDDPLMWFRVRKQISEEEFQAGRKWQGLLGTAEIADLRGIDTTKEFVDGGRFPELLTDAKQKAMIELGRISGILGQNGSSLVFDVLGKGMTIKLIAENRGISGRTELEFLGRSFRECLKTLALEWGYIPGRR